MSLLKELAIAIPILIVVAFISSHMVVIPTHSMTPTISIGDMVFVEKTDVLGFVKELNTDDIKVGDVVVYELNSTNGTQRIIHRVISVNESNGQKFYILKGDNNTVPDPQKVLPDEVVAKALTWGNTTLKIPQVGNFFLWIKNSTGF